MKLQRERGVALAMPGLDRLDVGDALPPLTLPPIDRTTLALFAGASGDHNPIHIDIDFARRAGTPDVFAHDMLSAAYVARPLTSWVAQRQVRNINLRFVGITQLGHVLTCSAKVAEKLQDGDTGLLKMQLDVCNQYGDRKIVGDALIAISATP